MKDTKINQNITSDDVLFNRVLVEKFTANFTLLTWNEKHIDKRVKHMCVLVDVIESIEKFPMRFASY